MAILKLHKDDSSRTKRQIKGVDRHEAAGFIGAIVSYTGFGKTRGIALRTIERCKPESLIVAVPSINLKEDWEELLSKSDYKYEVVVVNTLIKNTYKCDLLIVDEIHRFAAKSFVHTFKVVKYNKLLGLTATFQRSDERELLLLKYMSIVDNVPLEEGLKNGWVQPFKLHRVPIQLTPDELVEYKVIQKRYDDLAKEFPGRNPLTQAEFYISYLDLNKWVIGKSGTVWFLKTLYRAMLIKYAKVFLMRDIRLTNTAEVRKFDNVRSIFTYSTYTEAISTIKRSIADDFMKPTKEHDYAKLSIVALKFYGEVRKRKALLYNAHNKIHEAKRLIEKHQDDYKFVLSQEIRFLTELNGHLPADSTAMYHSKISLKKRKGNFKRFIDGRTKIKTLLSAKQLLTGTDVPKLSTLIICSYDTSAITSIQTIGRAIRDYPGKRVNIYYMYVVNSQEEKWLNKIFKQWNNL